MRLSVDREIMRGAYVDRDGIRHTSNPVGVEGFEIHIGELTIECEDERAVERLAHLILLRLGVDTVKEQA